MSQYNMRKSKKTKYVRRAFAIWAYMNGVFAIILSLAHIHLFGVLNSVYFGNDTPWLAQHGMIVGVTMIYISWHLWRGEHRARLLFLSLLFVEFLKYIIVVPSPLLVFLYGASFVFLFVGNAYFTRGTAGPSIRGRVQELGVTLVGVFASVILVMFMLSRDQMRLDIARRSLDRFGDFVISDKYQAMSVEMLRSSLLAGAASSLLAATLFFILWSLFRPIKRPIRHVTSQERGIASKLVQMYATSSEDYFKLWPHDKSYFWSADHGAFIAYKITKTVVFALADPIAKDRTQQDDILKEFIIHWESYGYRVCFLLVPETSTELYKDAGLNLTQIGSNAQVDIETFTQTTIKNKWWRWQMNRANKAGYVYGVSEGAHDYFLLEQAQQVSKAWLKKPGRTEQGFAMGSYSTEYMQASTMHYLNDDQSNLVAFANQIPVYDQLDQTTIDMMRSLPNASNAMPFLLANIITQLGKRGAYRYFDLGFVPLANMENRAASITKTIAAGRFSATGLEQFKNKFEPTWHKYYIAYDGDITDLAVIALNLEQVMKPANPS